MRSAEPLDRAWDFPRDPLVALREGDPAPFEEFVRRTSRKLLGFFRCLGAGVHLAEDLTQETYLKLYHHAPRYRAEQRFQAFCLQVAKNVWIDERRRRGNRPGESAAGGPAEASTGGGGADAARPRSAPPDPLAAATLQEEGLRARNALAGLPEGHRLVFELGVLQELSYAEIATLLAIPVGTVKSRMFHAVRRLRQALEEQTP